MQAQRCNEREKEAREATRKRGASEGRHAERKRKEEEEREGEQAGKSGEERRREWRGCRRGCRRRGKEDQRRIVLAIVQRVDVGVLPLREKRGRLHLRHA